MTWHDKLLNQLAAAMPCGYQCGGPPATEPTCLAAIALSHYGQQDRSLQALEWLGSIQNDDGSVGPTDALRSPGWPTALAVLAGAYVTVSSPSDTLGLCCNSAIARRADLALRRAAFDGGRAIHWLLDAKGGTLVRQSHLGHDSTLVGWPWVLGTHSWVEPTALAVLALKAIGENDHLRTREAVRLLRDRLLPDGGCNYGNTTVLGQTLRPHIQPTALALLALHGERDHDVRIARSIDWLQGEVNSQTAAASLAYALWALARYGRQVLNADTWLAAAAQRIPTQSSPHRMALLLLAKAALECGDSSSLSLSKSLISQPTSFASPVAMKSTAVTSPRTP